MGWVHEFLFPTDRKVRDLERRPASLNCALADKVRALETKVHRMTKELDDVKAGVAAVTAAVADAVKAIKDLAAQVLAAKPPHPADDPADLEAVASQLNGIASGLEAVIAAP